MSCGPCMQMNVETINFDKESPYDVLISATAGLGPDVAIEACLMSSTF